MSKIFTFYEKYGIIKYNNFYNKGRKNNMRKERRTLLRIIGVYIILLCCMCILYSTANNPETKKGAILTSIEQLQNLQVRSPIHIGDSWPSSYYYSGTHWYASYHNYYGSHWYSSYHHYYGSVGDYDDELFWTFLNKSVEEYSYKNKTIKSEKSQEYPRYEEDGCSFCDGDELTLREKCEELLYKVLIDEKNLLDDGIITEEVYYLQCEPFEKWLDRLETLPEEELQEEYIAILEYHLDKIAEEWADGEEVLFSS